MLKSDKLFVFHEMEQLERAVAQAGFSLDFRSIARLNTSFLEASEEYLVLNLKEYSEEPDNILFMTERETYLYSKTPPSQDAFKVFEKVTGKPFGTSTVVGFLALSKALANYKSKLEELVGKVKELGQSFDSGKYHDLLLQFETLYDRVEDLQDIVLRLEKRTAKQVETKHISFDYSILTAESRSLVDRCRNRFSILRDVARERETEATTLLNRRIERLNEVVKRLTALTVVLMIPTVIASHFGMNFVFMPELQVPWAYPAVIVGQIMVTVTSVVLFRRIKWL